MHDLAKKTVLGIVRGFWPAGAYTWIDINNKYPGLGRDGLFWESEQHMLRFYKDKENRKLVTTLHSAGARSFQHVEKAIFTSHSSKLKI